MASKKIIVGQIGCGAFAEGQDLPNFTKNPDVEVKWCCDLSVDRAEKLAAKFGVPRATGNFMDVIGDPEVGLIKIATSHEIHLPIIEAAAANGKHVFCEKPMALEEEEAFKIIGAVQKGGIKFCVDLNRRMAPSIRALRAKWLKHRNNPVHQPWRYMEIKRGKLPEESRTQLLIRVQDESASYRMIHLDPLHGGGLIIGESVHWLDLACWFFSPQAPVELLAWGSTRLSHGINVKFSEGDTATILFNCGGTFDYPKELYEVTHDGALFRNLCFLENEYFGVPGPERELFPLQRDCLPDVGAEGGFSGYMKKYRARVQGETNAKSGHNMLSVDKGHENMLNGFVASVIDGGPSPCDEISGHVSTYLAKLAIKSIELRQALPVLVEKIFPSIAKNLLVFLCFLCIMLASGCASVKPKPFTDFKASMKNAGAGIDNSLYYSYKLSREEFAHKLAAEKDLKFGDLILSEDNPGKKAWAANPSCVKIKNSIDVIDGINQAFCEYADILNKLATDEFKDAEDLEVAVKALNMNLDNAIKAAEFSKDNDAGELFTPAALESAKIFIAKKRPATLSEALDKNQAPFGEYCKNCIKLAGPVKTDMKATYVSKAESLKSAWEAAQAPEKKEKLVEQLLEVNDRYADMNEMYNAVLDIYEKLPGIHTSLRKAIENKAFFYQDLQIMITQTQKITKLCDKLKKN